MYTSLLKGPVSKMTYTVSSGTLNFSIPYHSRDQHTHVRLCVVVMRTQGNLRVVLNTMIWPNMLVERSSQKSIRISAVDANDGIKIYLIQVGQHYP